MRWFVVAAMWGVCSVVLAGEVFLIPANNPTPAYPRALYLAGIEGEVKVSMIVHADGSVSQVSAPEGAHPELVEASVTAVRQWKFKPWEISNERPERVDVVAPMLFRLSSDVPLDANEILKKVLCSDLSSEAKNYAQSDWVDMNFFFWARSYLAHSIASGLMPRDKRLELIAKLNRGVPSIIRRCNTHPTSRAVRFFPKEVRELL